MPDPDALIGSSDAALILGLEKTTVTRMAKDGRLRPVYKLPTRNGAYLFDRDAILALAERLDAERDSSRAAS